MQNIKYCTKCHKGFPETQEFFYGESKNKNGLRARCKQCESTRYKEYDSLNREKRLLAVKERRLRNPEKAREESTNGVRKWRKNNPEKRKLNDQVYRQKHRQRIVFHSHKYRLLKRKLPNSFTDMQWHQCLTWWHNCCAYCGAQQSFWNTIEVDHFIPISSSLSPGSVVENILPACRSCNGSKSNSVPSDWLLKKFGKHQAKKLQIRIVQYWQFVEGMVRSPAALSSPSANVRSRVVVVADGIEECTQHDR